MCALLLSTLPSSTFILDLISTNYMYSPTPSLPLRRLPFSTGAGRGVATALIDTIKVNARLDDVDSFNTDSTVRDLLLRRLLSYPI